MRRRVRTALHGLRRWHGRNLYPHQLRFQTWHRFGRHHPAPIDPLRNLLVDPATIDGFLDMGLEAFVRIRPDVGAIVDGDWDRDVTPLTEHFVYQSIHAHFVDGVAWERTWLHEVAMDGIRTGDRRYHGCGTAEELQTRLAEIERLLARVRTEGYRSQAELARQPGRHPLQKRKGRPPSLEEIIVDIDRDGRFLFVDGIHRLSVAKVAGVPRVPVCVLRRHAAWQAHRDRVASDPKTFPPATFDHPDLASLHR